MTDAEVARLGHQGWFVREGHPDAAVAAAVVARRAAEGLFTPAGVARTHQREDSIRSDRSLWSGPEDVELSGLHQGFERLRLELNESAWLGLSRFELQLAHYPGAGEHYVRHKDSFEGEANRRVTAIVYLNPRWEPGHGGALVIHSEGETAELAPVLGRLVVFLSAKVEHEVLPTRAPRYAATAWYYGS